MQAKSSTNIKGIDVSRWQGVIDWTKVAADGVRYAFVKATEGVTGVDAKLKANALGANAAGVKVGYYHYARPENNEAVAEARHFAAAVAGYPCHWPLALDVEGEASKLGAVALTRWCEAFLTELERASGRRAMIYSGASFVKTYLGKELAGWPLWIAHYGVDKPMSNPTWDRWSVFQYSDKGRVAGIQGNVDLNAMEAEFYGRYAAGEEDKPMTKEEKEAFEQLNAQVARLTGTVDTLTKQLESATAKIPAPKWFVTEFGANVVAQMSDPTGTMEFWRAVAVSLRALKPTGTGDSA